MPIKLSVNLAKILPYCIRERPDEFGLVPDTEGWISIKELLYALHEEDGFRGVKLAVIKEAVLILEKKDNIEIQEKRIRIMPVQKKWSSPPAFENPHVIIYHAVRPKGYPGIKEHGLVPTKHQWIILSIKRQMAERLGKRLGHDAVILEIEARKAAEKGTNFLTSGDQLILADYIAPEFIHGPPVERILKKLAKDKEKQKTTKKKKKKQKEEAFTPGSFIYSPATSQQSEKGKGRKKKIKWKEERKKSKKIIPE